MKHNEKIILNQHTDSTNVVEKEDMVNEITNVLDILIDRLKPICGPFTRDTLLFPYTIVNTPISDSSDSRVFLHDGIKIIQAIEFTSPIQQYIRNIIAHIGSSVDRVSHDGTTSAMLFSCHLLKNLIERFSINEDFHRMTIKQFLDKANNFFDTVLKKLEESSLITVDDPYLIEKGFTENERASIIAFMQAYTSSGGDFEIAKAIQKFYLEQPRQYWSNTIQYETPRVETDYKIKCEYLEFELELQTICGNDFTKIATSLDGVTCERDDIDIFVNRTGISDNSVESIELFNYIKRSDRPLLILYPNMNTFSIGNSISTEIIALTDPAVMGYGQTKDIILCGYSKNGSSKAPSSLVVDSLVAKSNRIPFDKSNDLEESIIKGASITLDQHSLRISNVTPVDNDVIDEYKLIHNLSDTEHTNNLLSNIHPGELDPDKYVNYTKYIDFLTRSLEIEKKSHRPDDNYLMDLEDALSKMKQRYSLVLRLGGTTHDILSMKSVIEDAAGAALTSIQTGIYTNPFWRLANIAHYAYDSDNEVDLVIADLSYSIYAACSNVVESIYSPKSKHQDELILGFLGYLPSYLIDVFKESNFLEGTYRWIFDDALSTIDKIRHVGHMGKFDVDEFIEFCSKESYEHYCDGGVLMTDVDRLKELITKDTLDFIIPPVQTSNSIAEIFKRAKDLLLKLVVTDSIVVQGTVWDKKN